MINPPDPLEGQEIGMLNTMLAKVYPLARDGDAAAIDRVLKILALKQKYAGKPAKPADDSWEM